MQALLKHIGVDGVRYQEIFITSFDGDVLGLYDYLTEYENIDELNHLACLLSEMSQSDLEKFEAVIDAGHHTSNVKDLINLTYNLDCYDLYPDIADDEALGRLYLQEFGTIPVPEALVDYIDYEAYGRDARINENGHFAPGGYVRGSGEGSWRSITVSRTSLSSTRSLPCPSSTSGADGGLSGDHRPFLAGGRPASHGQSPRGAVMERRRSYQCYHDRPDDKSGEIPEGRGWRGSLWNFPPPKRPCRRALKAIGVDGIRCREVFLTEHDSNLSGFCHCINQSDPVDELNYLCRLLSDMTDTELATFQAVVEYGAHNGSAADLINLALNVEHYDFYMGVDNDKELGHIYADDMGDIEIPEDVRPYFDFEAYGRKVRKEDKGCFVNDG